MLLVREENTMPPLPVPCRNTLKDHFRSLVEKRSHF
jgi:hypothetical protein